ncbi:DNA polymerase III subunit alpha [Saccharicrinis sp. FJH54]|uniref:DNA polymerase III subunit alpha n=1 Tax=Saccharicrinis sp. FJH54 TaxID=3344665 RepID=UPI0035D43161
MLLNNHTYFSYKFGTLSIEQLLEEAQSKGHKALALTDVNSTSAVFDFIRLGKQASVHTVIGIDFRNSAEQKYIGIAKNNEGFRELNEHLTQHLHTGVKFSDQAPDFMNSYVIYPFEKTACRELKSNEFIGVRPYDLPKMIFSEWRHYPDKLVAQTPVTFRHKRDFNVHRLLRTIDNNTLLSKLPKSEEASQDEIMMSPEKIKTVYEDYSFMVDNAEKLIGNCSISFEYKTSKNKKCYTGSPEEDYQLIVEECKKGLQYRFGEHPSQQVIERTEHELKVIKELNFCSYFLINWDMVNFARRRGFYYIGRGSGANSMVAYLLRITDVDPIELDLYFERFINPSRTSPPDFDIDFSSWDRNEVTQYLFDRHGWDRTALVGAYSTFQYKSVVRELGKSFGLPAADIEKLQEAKGKESFDEIGQLVLKYSKLIEGFPSHLTVHSSGIIISDEPLSNYTATIMPPKGFPTVFFSMIEAEDIGFSKFDVLGQRGLSKIKDTLEIVYNNKGVEFDIHDIKRFKEDPVIRSLLKTGQTIGCFYIESPAMRMLLQKLEADDYLRLVAASSIIRPGVAKSGMMQEYVLRYRHPEMRELARKEMPELYDLLKETYGVMVYQEDVLKVAHVFAGLTLAEADILRRGMSWKFKQRNEFDKVRDKFFLNCRERSYPEYIIERVWKQIESFANYAFAKGHSASYAVESFQALFLKAYYPLEYLVATINNGGGFYRIELYIHEARMHGAKIEAPCVNRSDDITVLCDDTIFLGFAIMRNLDYSTQQQILLKRYQYGYYKNLQDFIKKVPISLEQITLLIRIGAFRFTGKSVKELLWDAHFILVKSKKTVPSNTLFEEKVKEFKLPALYHHQLEQAYNELELLGFLVTFTPFQLVESMPLRSVKALQLRFLVDYQVQIIGYLVHVKKTRTHDGKIMSFGVFVDVEGHWIDTVQFPQVANDFPFRGPGCYLIRGIVMNELGFVSIRTTELYKLANTNIEEESTRLKQMKR